MPVSEVSEPARRRLISSRSNRFDVIVDGRVLREDFVPSEVVHRHDEVNLLSETLEPLLSDGRPDPSFLFGPTGVGKTCIARYTLAQLREQEPAVRVAYVNCWQEYTRFRVLYRILEGSTEPSTSTARRRKTNCSSGSLGPTTSRSSLFWTRSTS